MANHQTLPLGARGLAKFFAQVPSLGGAYGLVFFLACIGTINLRTSPLGTNGCILVYYWCTYRQGIGVIIEHEPAMHGFFPPCPGNKRGQFGSV
jgi:hypothetical protein